MKVGILGGTFDPVHCGHLTLAEAALKQLGLDKVVFVPAGDPWMKTAERRITPSEHRLAMLRLALEDSHRFEISTVDLERPGKTYAVDTVSDIKRALPKWSRLYFILGSDSLRDLPLWKRPKELLRKCWLAVATRPGFPVPDLAQMESRLSGISRRVVFLDMVPMDISSSEIRRLVRNGSPVRHMVPEAVAQYIEQHGLYLE